MKPFKEAGLICERLDNIHAKTNVPHDIKHHSQGGFEWGYGGAGPLELSLNIMHHLFPVGCDDKNPVTVGSHNISWTAYKLYRRFKWDFIERIPHKGGQVSIEEINEWIEEQLGASGETS